MKIFISLALGCVFLIANLSLLAQSECGTDHYIDHLKSKNPVWKKVERLSNNQITDFIFDRKLENRASESFIVPTVVHIIHNNGDENISDAQVLACIDHMNEAFANSGEYMTENGVDVGISFCLAQRDEDGNETTGINRVVSDLTDMFTPSQDVGVKSLISWDQSQYMNIWVVNSITGDPDQTGIAGFASLPFIHGSANDGIVCEADYFGSSITNSKVMVHEAGHYLGLYHTFNGGCPNDDCLTSGDFVCDTPPDNVLFSTCGNGTNSCDTDEDDVSTENPFRPTELGGIGDQIDDQENYMDYTGLYCFDRFTQGQADRMCAMADVFRSSLFGGLQCYPPCDNPIEIVCTPNGNDVLVGETFSIDNSSTGYSSVDWFVDGVLVSSSDNFSYTFSESGTYTVTAELNNSDFTCLQIYEVDVDVICDVDLSYTVSSTDVAVGEIITAEYVGGESDFEWLVDGVSAGTDLILELSFDQPGLHSINVLVSGEICSEFGNSNSLQIGVCGRSNHGNLWYTYGGDSWPLIFDFNSPEIAIEYGWFESSFETKSTWCDSNGEMLLTTDGLSVWGADENLLENGTGLMASESSHKGTIIMKAPGENSNYYLFTSDAFENNNANGVRYSVIDLSMNDGLGAVTDEKNIFITQNNDEALALSYHSNLEDFWLVVYDRANTEYRAYLVDENGVSDEPVVTDSETLPFSAAKFAFSPLGNLFAYENRLYYFDQTSGMITVAHEFDFENMVSHSFSEDGSQLYLCSHEAFQNQEIHRYDVSDPENVVFNTSESLNLNTVPIDCQLAPNGKIYISGIYETYILEVENPNSSDGPIEINDSSLPFGSGIVMFSNVFHGHLTGSSINVGGEAVACVGQSFVYNITGPDLDDAVLEWIVEGDVEIINQGEEFIELLFTEPGNVHLQATATDDCGLRVDDLVVEVGVLTETGLPEQVSGCESETILLTLNDGFSSVEWQDGSLNSTYEVSDGGTYSVTVLDEFGCSQTDVCEVEFFSPDPIDLGPDTDICDGIILVLDAGTDYEDYAWQDGSPGSTYTVANGGTYIVSASIPCASTDTIFVEACEGGIDSVEELLNDPEIGLFPNPAISFFTLQGLNYAGQLNVKMFDARGREVVNATGSLESIFPISTNDFKSGLYQVVVTVEGRSKVKTLQLLGP